MFEIEKHHNGYVVKGAGRFGRNIYVKTYTRNHEYIFTTDYLYAKKYTEGTAICHMNALNALEGEQK